MELLKENFNRIEGLTIKRYYGHKRTQYTKTLYKLTIWLLEYQDKAIEIVKKEGGRSFEATSYRLREPGFESKKDRERLTWYDTRKEAFEIAINHLLNGGVAVPTTVEEEQELREFLRGKKGLNPFFT